jgi:kinesin family member C2/C3
VDANCLCQIAKLKLALDDKEREAAQYKDHANRAASEMRNTRTRSPLTTMSSKHETSQESSVDTCTSEVLV